VWVVYEIYLCGFCWYVFFLNKRIFDCIVQMYAPNSYAFCGKLICNITLKYQLIFDSIRRSLGVSISDRNIYIYITLLKRYVVKQ